jgi:hypothetical protein
VTPGPDRYTVGRSAFPVHVPCTRSLYASVYPPLYPSRQPAPQYTTARRAGRPRHRRDTDTGTQAQTLAVAPATACAKAAAAAAAGRGGGGAEDVRKGVMVRLAERSRGSDEYLDLMLLVTGHAPLSRPLVTAPFHAPLPRPCPLATPPYHAPLPRPLDCARAYTLSQPVMVSVSHGIRESWYP